MAGDLMADDQADATVVGGVVGLGVEEGRLQDAGREEWTAAQRDEVPGGAAVRFAQPLAAVDSAIAQALGR